MDHYEFSSLRSVSLYTTHSLEYFMLLINEQNIANFASATGAFIHCTLHYLLD